MPQPRVHHHIAYTNGSVEDCSRVIRVLILDPTVYNVEPVDRLGYIRYTSSSPVQVDYSVTSLARNHIPKVEKPQKITDYSDLNIAGLIAASEEFNLKSKRELLDISLFKLLGMGGLATDITLVTQRWNALSLASRTVIINAAVAQLLQLIEVKSTERRPDAIRNLDPDL